MPQLNGSVTPDSAAYSIDDEIAEYSVRENVFFIARHAFWLEVTKKLKSVPSEELMPIVILMAEEYEKKFGGSNLNTVEALEAYAEKELIARFGV
jgi:hypothetical protein